MRFQTSNVFMKIAIGAILFSGARTAAERIPRIELLKAVRVTGANVLLSDLLPENVPESLRTQAAEISLGAAPQLGNSRTLERDVMINQISANPGVLMEVMVPEHIMVSRNARSITVSEVFDAIQKSLERSGVRAATTLRAEDILVQSEVFVNPGDAGLQVMRMDLDAGLQRARFLLWPSRDPAVLPFFVTVRLDGNLGVVPVHGAELDRPVGRHGNSSAPKPAATQEILVAPGERATLVLRSATLQMFADVAPLERGSMGQQIRVRMIDTGKVFSAQVDGRAHLEVKF